MGINSHSSTPNSNTWVSAYPTLAKEKVTTDPSAKEITGGLAVKRYGKLEMAKVLLTSPDSVKPALKALGYMLAHQVTRGETSKQFEAKAAHSGFDLFKIVADQAFGNENMGRVRNIGKKDVLMNKQDCEAADQLREKCQELKKWNPLFKQIDDKSIKEKVPDSMITDGICAGIRLDIAKKHLIEGQTVEHIIASNEKGASAEAAANQSIYELLKATEDPYQALAGVFKDLKEIAASQGGYELAQVDFDLVGQALVQADDDLSQGIIYKQVDFGSFNELYQRNDQHPNDLAHLIKDLVNDQKNQVRAAEAKPETASTSWMGRKEDKGDNSFWTIKDPLAFQEAALKKMNANYKEAIIGKKSTEVLLLNKEREKNIKALKWTVALLQHKQGIEENIIKTVQQNASKNANFSSVDSKNYSLSTKLREQASSIFGKTGPSFTSDSIYDSIADPSIRYAIKELGKERKNNIKYQAVAKTRGLELESLKEVMGHYSLHQSNDSYLNNLSKLEVGTYSVNFATGNGGHAITYIKESDEKGYILDPNGIQIKCGDAAETAQQFKKLLGFYEEPDVKSPTYQKGKTDHHLDFQRFKLPK